MPKMTLSSWPTRRRSRCVPPGSPAPFARGRRAGQARRAGRAGRGQRPDLMGAQRPLRRRARPWLRAPASMRCAACRKSGSGTSPVPPSRSSRRSGSTISAGCGTWASTARRSALLNDLYDGKETTRRGAPACSRCSGREFRNPADMLERARGRPVYLGLAMTPAQRLKLKPHDLLINLPLARRPDQSGG